MNKALVTLCAIFLSSCAATSPTAIAKRIENASTVNLWIAHNQATLSPLQLAYIETELASRGETTFGTSYLGKRTASAFSLKQYRRSPSSTNQADIYNCSDFATSWQAQRFFLNNGGPNKDPNNLDGDGDGLACEWGKRLRSIAVRARSAQRARQIYYAPKCYTGPRGGRYTITSSGRKNYGGC